MAERSKVKQEKWADPSLTVGTHSERFLFDEHYNNSITAEIHFPFGLASQSAPKIAAAQVLLAQVQSQRDELKRQLELALQQAALWLKTTRQALEPSEHQNTLAQENLRLAR
ncbi:MAG: hypothetical protein L0Y67_06155 [Gammaproteobacteria bacterium]|nr:hypothetical protein [Gammaproteobacteria bacterium]MCI0591169.1 hypothetical protein [Gammaproteobacteria bacterium]